MRSDAGKAICCAEEVRPAVAKRAEIAAARRDLGSMGKARLLGLRDGSILA
jgi:hypothetical protein